MLGCPGAHLEMAGNIFKADIIPAEPIQAAAAKPKIAGIASLQHAWAQVRASLQGRGFLTSMPLRARTCVDLWLAYQEASHCV